MASSNKPSTILSKRKGSKNLVSMKSGASSSSYFDRKESEACSEYYSKRESVSILNDYPNNTDLDGGPE